MNNVPTEYIIQVSKNEKIVRNENKVPRWQVFETEEEMLDRVDKLITLLDNKYIDGFKITIFETDKAEDGMWKYKHIASYQKGKMGNVL